MLFECLKLQHFQIFPNYYLKREKMIKKKKKISEK
jgi:hypothetical protein